MSELDRKIGQAIIDIANKGKKGRFPVMMGSVVAGSVDEEQGTCKVLLSVNDENTQTDGVLLSAKLGNVTGLLLYPADDSIVLVAEINGPGMYGIVQCSQLNKVIVKIGIITLHITDSGIMINGDDYGGLVKVEDLVNSINAIEEKVNELVEHYNQHLHMGSGGLTGTPQNAAGLAYVIADDLDETTVDQLASEHVKHG